MGGPVYPVQPGVRQHQRAAHVRGPLDPSSHPQGITTRLILDATTPVPPDDRGDKGQLITPYPEAAEWEQILRDMLR